MCPSRHLIAINLQTSDLTLKSHIETTEAKLYFPNGWGIRPQLHFMLFSTVHRFFVHSCNVDVVYLKTKGFCTIFDPLFTSVMNKFSVHHTLFALLLIAAIVICGSEGQIIIDGNSSDWNATTESISGSDGSLWYLSCCVILFGLLIMPIMREGTSFGTIRIFSSRCKRML